MSRGSWMGAVLGVATFLSMEGRANVVLDWNALLLDAIRTDTTGPTLSSRNLALLHTAIYDAVNSVTRTHQPYQFQLALGALDGTSAEAAAVAAAREISVSLYPPFRARAEELFESYLAATEADTALTNGLVLGKQVAQSVLAARADDGSQTDVPYIPSDAPGQWRRTAPFFRPPLTPQWRYVRPFALPSVAPFVPGPPPALDSPAYAEAFNEVKVLGARNSTVRTAEQSEIAVFWSDFSYTAMPPGHWHEIAAVIAGDRHLDLAETARLFALISLAQADAAIVCWEAKFRYNLWRPITAIQRADEDQNSQTEADGQWNHYLVSPPFPAYTSGHSTFSKASAGVLAHFLGTDAVNFTVGSDSLPGVFRSFRSLSECADEVGMSRIYGGIHFQFDNVAGKVTGKKVADYVNANWLLPNVALPLLVWSDSADSGAILRLHGNLGTTLILESTVDLVNWTPLATNQARIGGASVILSADTLAHQERQFFRVREQVER